MRPKQKMVSSIAVLASVMLASGIAVGGPTAAQVTDDESLKAFVEGAKAQIEAITDMERTDSKGVKIAEELIGGARRDGRKFLRYHYDNPAIEGDEDTGSPKLGYAVSFPEPNTDQRGVIGSGIYLEIGEE